MQRNQHDRTDDEQLDQLEVDQADEFYDDGLPLFDDEPVAARRTGVWASNYADAVAKGWTPLWLPPGRKALPLGPRDEPLKRSLTGYSGVDADLSELFAITYGPDGTGEGACAPNGNIATRAPQGVVVDGVTYDVVFWDVDDYAKGTTVKTGAALTLDVEARAGVPFPATIAFGSRGDEHVSKKFAYLVPSGEKLITGIDGGIDVIQWFHRYAVMPPSTNPDNRGSAFRAYRGVAPRVGACEATPADGLPAVTEAAVLPPEILAVLRDTAGFTDVDDITDAQVRAFIDALPQPDTMCKATTVKLRSATQGLTKGSRHDKTMHAVLGLLRLGEMGHTGVPKALRQLRSAFLTAAADRGQQVAEAEFQRMITNPRGVALITAQPTPETERGCRCLLGEAEVDGILDAVRSGDEDIISDIAAALGGDALDELMRRVQGEASPPRRAATTPARGAAPASRTQVEVTPPVVEDAPPETGLDATPLSYVEQHLPGLVEEADPRERAVEVIEDGLGADGRTDYESEDDRPKPFVPTDADGNVTGLPVLPQEFWAARPELRHIQQVAHSRNRGADVAFACTLARIAAVNSHHNRIETGIGGGAASMNLIVLPVGDSAAGKTSGSAVAKRVLPVPASLLHGPVPLGTGEGIAESFMGNVEEEDTGGRRGRPRTLRIQVRWNVAFELDEGAALMSMLARNGTTVMPAIRSLWSGATIGQQNSSADRTRIVERYSASLVMGFQPETIQPWLADVHAGTPQRGLYVSVTDPHIPDEIVEDPGPLPLTAEWLANTHDSNMEFVPSLLARIRRDDLRRARGEYKLAPLDAHGPLMKIKLSGLLALLAKRRVITEADWELAEIVWATSCAVRDALVEVGRREQAAAEKRRRDRNTMDHVEAAVHVSNAVDAQGQKRARDQILRKLEGGQALTRVYLRRNSSSAAQGFIYPVIDAMVADGELVELPDGKVTIGSAGGS